VTSGWLARCTTSTSTRGWLYQGSGIADGNTKQRAEAPCCRGLRPRAAQPARPAGPVAKVELAEEELDHAGMGCLTHGRSCCIVLHCIVLRCAVLY
jgi:hypothetical protein